MVVSAVLISCGVSRCEGVPISSTLQSSAYTAARSALVTCLVTTKPLVEKKFEKSAGGPRTHLVSAGACGCAHNVRCPPCPTFLSQSRRTGNGMWNVCLLLSKIVLTSNRLKCLDSSFPEVSAYHHDVPISQRYLLSRALSISDIQVSTEPLGIHLHRRQGHATTKDI